MVQAVALHDDDGPPGASRQPLDPAEHLVALQLLEVVQRLLAGLLRMEAHRIERTRKTLAARCWASTSTSALSQNVALRDGDTIMVPERFF